MKKIATMNFKGGVGKTTITWALGHVISHGEKSCLLFDLDPQMSLTDSIATNEDGIPFKSFSYYQKTADEKKMTIFEALKQYINTQNADFSKFSISPDFIYKITKNYHFIPSVEQLYWAEIELKLKEFRLEKIYPFIPHLLDKLASSQHLFLPNYEYALFDCPPSVSSLSLSILSCCDFILIPITPDFFGSKGISIMIHSIEKISKDLLKIRPKIGIVMNRAKRPGGSSTKLYSLETQRYLDYATNILKRYPKAKLFQTTIPELVKIKRAIQEGMTPELTRHFGCLWKEIEEFIHE